MVVLGAEAVPSECSGELLGGPPRAGVHDRRAPVERLETTDDGAHPVIGVPHLLDLVPEIRPHDRRPDDLRLTTERVADLAGGLGRGRRGHPEQRRFPELRERVADEEVVGAEIVSPHAHAMRLVDDHEPDSHGAKQVDEATLSKAFRSRVDEALVSGRGRGETVGGLVGRERRVHERRRRRNPGRKLVDLVLHQGDQR